MMGRRMGLVMTTACWSVAMAACAHTSGGGAAMVEQRSEEVQLATATGVLHGTLLRPGAAALARTGGRRPVALILPGSGPTDRDGNSLVIPGDNNSLRMLAEALAAEGIATLRVDKRGIAASAAAGRAEADLRFDHYVDDAVAWLAMLRGTGEFDRFHILGHSEGALVATLAAQQAPVHGVVLLAGTGRSMAATIRGQLAPQVPPQLLAQADSAFVAMREGRTVTVPPGLESLFRPSVQPYLRSVMDIDPAAELARLSVPVLVISGTTDVQVSIAEDARRLAAVQGPRVELVVVEGMNHVLKAAEGPIAAQLASYGDPTLPLADGLVPPIAAFLRAH
jgi:uncharacterized protein